MTNPTYPHLSRASDLIYFALYRANGQTLTFREVYNAHKPGVKHGCFNTTGRAAIKRLRADFRECGHDGLIISVPGVGYRLDMSKAPPYRHQLDLTMPAEAPKPHMTIVPRPPVIYNVDPTGWIADRFQKVA